MSNEEATDLSRSQVEHRLSQARGELASALDALEYKLDVPARFTEWVDARKRRFAAAWDEEPVAVASTVAGALAVIGTVITLITVAVRRR